MTNQQKEEVEEKDFIRKLQEEMKKQPNTIKGLEKTIKLAGIIMSLLTYDIEERLEYEKGN